MMKKYILISLATFLFLSLAIQNKAICQFIEYEEEEWREDFMDSKLYMKQVSFASSTPFINRKMMKFLYFYFNQGFNVMTAKVTEEKSRIESIGLKKKADGINLLEEKLFVSGNEIKDYLLKNLNPNGLITVKEIDNAEYSLKRYEFVFD